MARLPTSVFLIELPLWKNCAGLPFICRGALHGRQQERGGWLYEGQRQPRSVIMRYSRLRRRTSIS
jgi:hypothetical protein